MKKISLIVPVYNVERYVLKCIESCLNQNLSKQEYEIIIINDGSTDQSLEIINSLVQKFSNIHLISQQNAGLSAARNKGLSVATGEFVWFIDSDDWIEQNCLSELFNICNQNSLDMLAIVASDSYDDHKNRRFSFDEFTTDLYSGKSLLKKESFQQCAPFYLFSRQFLLSNGLLFFEGIFHEDLEFTPRALYLAKRVMFRNTSLYNVFQSPNSIMRSINPKKSFDLIRVSNNLLNFEEQFVTNEYKPIFYDLISLAINNSLHNTFTMSSDVKKELSLCFFQNSKLFKSLSKSRVLKYRIEGQLFTLFPKNIIKIYQLLKLIG